MLRSKYIKNKTWYSQQKKKRIKHGTCFLHNHNKVKIYNSWRKKYQENTIWLKREETHNKHQLSNNTPLVLYVNILHYNIRDIYYYVDNKLNQPHLNGKSYATKL